MSKRNVMKACPTSSCINEAWGTPIIAGGKVRILTRYADGEFQGTLKTKSDLGGWRKANAGRHELGAQAFVDAAYACSTIAFGLKVGQFFDWFCEQIRTEAA